MKKTIHVLSIGLILSVLVSSCVDHNIPNLNQTCQIVQEDVKRGFVSQSAPPNPNSETVTLDPATYDLPGAQTFSLSTTQLRNFTYNGQGQLLQENIFTLPGEQVIKYVYTPTTLVKSGDSSGPTSYVLNAQGLITSLSTFNGTATYAYDANGYLIEANEFFSSVARKITYTIVDGNVVKRESVDSFGKITTIYTYDLTRPNLPNKRIFEGTQSRNLLVKSVQDYVATDGLKTNFTKFNTYTYDNQGRVKRRLEVTTYTSSFGGGPFTEKAAFVEAVDYTYSCR